MASNVSTIDTQNSGVSFEVKKLGILTIRGTLTDFTGEVSFDKNALDQASFNVCVSPITIDTGNAKRDEHLKSKDFFHVNEHPKICFQSTSLKSDKSGYRAIGNLSMLGVTHEISIPFTFSDGVFTGKFTLNRMEYSLGKKIPAFVVGKTIQISVKCLIR